MSVCTPLPRHVAAGRQAREDGSKDGTSASNGSRRERGRLLRIGKEGDRKILARDAHDDGLRRIEFGKRCYNCECLIVRLMAGRQSLRAVLCECELEASKVDGELHLVESLGQTDGRSVGRTPESAVIAPYR